MLWAFLSISLALYALRTVLASAQEVAFMLKSFSYFDDSGSTENNYYNHSFILIDNNEKM